MTQAALALALGAAVLHATWNLFVKSSSDRLVAGFTVSVGAALLNLPIVAWVGLPDREVWGLIGIAAVIQTIYMFLLVAAYKAGDLSFVYPIARGSAPVIVTVAGVAWLDDRVAPLGIVGVLVVAGALALLAVGRRDRSGLGWALATGCTIAIYTTLDAASSRIQGSAIPVVATEFVVHGILLTLAVMVVRSPAQLLGAIRESPIRALFGAAGNAAGYLMVMMAAVIAPVGLVSGVRETSVVFGVAAGRRVLGERVEPRQFAAVLLAVGGIVLMALA